MARGPCSFHKDRTFPRLVNWAQFIVRWEAAHTVEEAIGLLHAGPHVPTDGAPPGVAALERVEFYLHWAGQEVSTITTVAQQVIVKGLLESPAIPLCEETIPAHKLLIRFLREPNFDLKRPPYPRFASNYILRLYNAWRYNHRGGSFPEAVHAALQDATEDVLWPVLSWGYGWVLSDIGPRKDVIEVIEKFLGHHRYNFEAFMRRGPDSMVRIEDLSGENTALRLCDRAAWALLRLQFKHSGGISVKLGWDKVLAPGETLCDGCNVRAPWEHKCHGENAVMYGEQTYKPCECQRCAAAGLPVGRR